jgi:hypothetical protein
MNTIEQVTPDNRKLTFELEAMPVRYGDNRTFYEYRVVMFHGMQAVGIKHGPRRQTPRKADCLRMARVELATLRSHRLFIIHVTKKHIQDGVERNCDQCAVAQALWHNQERMGFPKYEYGFDVRPYGAFVDPQGIVRRRLYRSNDECHIPQEEVSDLVTNWRDGFYIESMMEWTMRWDEWAESRYMSLKDWREEHGYEPSRYPSKPAPCSFVLDLDEFKSMSQEESAAA